MKTKNIIRIGFWVVLISALVITLVLIPSLEYYIIGVLLMLLIYGMATFRARLRVKEVLSEEQAANVVLHNRSMQ